MNQRKIIDFLVKNEVRSPIRRPVRSPVLIQPRLEYFYNREANARRLQSRRNKQRKKYSQNYHQNVTLFRRKYAEKAFGDVFVGSHKGICYYRGTDFYDYKAVDPSSGLDVGKMTLCDDYWLSEIEVKAEHRRQGIGTHLVRVANQATGGRVQVSTGQDYNSRYRLTHEGMCLIKACKRKGILLTEQTPNWSIPSPTFD